MPPHQTMLLAACALASGALLAAQTTAIDPSGHWEGSIQAPDKDVKIAIDLARNSRGEFTGAFGNPAENLQGLPLSGFAVDAGSVRFQIKGAPGERIFKGLLSADGQSISGDYSQSGFSVPFRITRAGEARFESPVKNAPVGKELEGVWNGTLRAGEKELRAILTLSNQPDGSAAGNIDSVDEGLEIPITTIVQKDSSLTLVLKSVGASYSGTLSPDGAELAGTYTQRSLALPLTFRRSTSAEGKK